MMSRAAAHLEMLTAKLAGGTVEAQGAVDLARTDRPFDIDASARSINLETLQRALLPAPRATGTATVSTVSHGVLGSRWNWEDAAKTIEGRGQLEVLDGAVMGIDLTGTVEHQLNRLIGKAVQKTAERDRTPFSRATAVVTLSGGVGSIGSFEVDSDDFALTASGRVGLTPPQPLGLKAEMRLSEPISRRFAKSAVSLLAVRGRLAIPVLIQGTLAQPIVLPDAQLLAKRTGKRLNERVLNEVMSGQVEELRQTGKELLKGLLGK